ncbi:MAG TPA: ATP-dependent DNA ligase, partial [Burkholderiales bacterium]|nr:ATP-dependent DNA ligase [Burkholderiales bacterium]
MALPLQTSYAPMEAKLVPELPTGAQWQYEPKFDGFRCLAFKDDGKVDLRSKSGQPFNRYFPEVVAALEKLPAKRFVLDGELVVPEGDVLSFDELLMRIHPAQSRVTKLAAAHPALFIVFDLLVDEGGAALVETPLTVRRPALERFMDRYGKAEPLLRLSPLVTEVSVANDWVHSLGTGLDGIM